MTSTVSRTTLGRPCPSLAIQRLPTETPLSPSLTAQHVRVFFPMSTSPSISSISSGLSPNAKLSSSAMTRPRIIIVFVVARLPPTRLAAAPALIRPAFCWTIPLVRVSRRPRVQCAWRRRRERTRGWSHGARNEGEVGNDHRIGHRRIRSHRPRGARRDDAARRVRRQQPQALSRRRGAALFPPPEARGASPLLPDKPARALLVGHQAQGHHCARSGPQEVLVQFDARRHNLARPPARH